MTRYIVEGPDGKRYIVEGPDAAAAPTGGGSPTTPAPQPSEGAQEPARAGGYGATMAGVADAGIKGYLGMKQLFGGLDEDEQKVLQEIAKENKEEPNPGRRLLGNVGANIAATLIPGNKVAQGLNRTRLLMAASPAVAAGLSSAGASAATEAVLAPGQGDSFGAQMADKGQQALRAGGIGGALGGTMSKISRAFRPTPEAENLMRQGVYPTLSQGADSNVGRFVGGLTSGVLPTAKRQNAEIVDAFVKRVLPNVDTRGMSTSEISGLMDHGLKKEYDALLSGKVFRLTPTARRQIWAEARRGAGTEPDVAAETMRRMGEVGNAMRAGNNVRLSSQSLQNQLNYIQDQINRVSRDPSTKAGEVKRGLIAAKESVQNLVRNPGLSPDELAQLKNLDGRYSDALRFLDAAEGVGAQQQMKASDLMRGFRNLDPKGGRGFAMAEAPVQRELLEPAIRTMGLAPNQDEARALLVSLGRAGLKTGAGAAATAVAPGLAAPVYATSLLGQTKRGSRALFGDYAAQRALANQLRNSGVLPATGGALNMQEEE